MDVPFDKLLKLFCSAEYIRMCDTNHAFIPVKRIDCDQRECAWTWMYASRELNWPSNKSDVVCIGGNEN